MRPIPTFTLIALLGLPAASARADFIYQFEQSNYTVAPGGTVPVRVFLQETVTTQLRDEGLFSGAVKVNWDNAPVPSDPARVLQDADIVPNPGFNGFTLLERTATSAALYGEIQNNPADLLHPVETSAPFRILLGTFTFTAGLVNGQVTHLQAKDFDPSLDETVTGQGHVLDSAISVGTATVTVTAASAVPEPSSVVLALLGGVSLCGYGWLRRRCVHFAVSNSHSLNAAGMVESSVVSGRGEGTWLLHGLDAHREQQFRDPRDERSDPHPVRHRARRSPRHRAALAASLR